MITVLVNERRNIDPTLREELLRFGSRFPESAVYSTAALQMLDERELRTS